MTIRERLLFCDTNRYYFQFLGKWYEIKWIPETYIDPEDNFKDYVWRQSLYNESYAHIISHGRYVFLLRCSERLHSFRKQDGRVKCTLGIS